jgi:predicted transport protein
MTILKRSGLLKRESIIDGLKEKYLLNHLQASLLTGLYLNKGKPVYPGRDNLLEDQFKYCKTTRPLFDSIAEKIFDLFYDAKLIPKKNYLSFAGIREFAAVEIKQKTIRIGMDLGDLRFTKNLKPSKIKNTNSRVSHMTIISAAEQFDRTINQYLCLSYYRTHNY